MESARAEPVERSEGGKAAPTDAELVLRFKRGDGLAFQAIAERYVRLAGAIAYGVVGDYDQAADIVQDAFIKLHGALPSLREPEKLKPWLHGVVRSCALDALRRRRRSPSALSSLEDGGGALVGRSELPGSGIEREELESGVLAAIRDLPEAYREVVLMKYVGDRSYKEISETLGLTIETIESRLFRARKLLKESLARFGRLEGARDARVE